MQTSSLRDYVVVFCLPFSCSYQILYAFSHYCCCRSNTSLQMERKSYRPKMETKRHNESLYNEILISSPVVSLIAWSTENIAEYRLDKNNKYLPPKSEYESVDKKQKLGDEMETTVLKLVLSRDDGEEFYNNNEGKNGDNNDMDYTSTTIESTDGQINFSNEPVKVFTADSSKVGKVTVRDMKTLIEPHEFQNFCNIFIPETTQNDEIKPTNIISVLPSSSTVNKVVNLKTSASATQSSLKTDDLVQRGVLAKSPNGTLQPMSVADLKTKANAPTTLENVEASQQLNSFYGSFSSSIVKVPNTMPVVPPRIVASSANVSKSILLTRPTFLTLRPATLQELQAVNTTQKKVVLHFKKPAEMSIPCFARFCQNKSKIICSKCRSVKYCSVMCQESDWYDVHHSNCETLYNIRNQSNRRH